MPSSPSVAPELAARSAAEAVDALEVTVATLKANALTGTIQWPLRDRNIGVLCEDPQRPDVFLLQRAATDLGARVAVVQSNPAGASGLPALEQTSRVLGRLYDVLICVQMPEQVVQSLRETVGIPVIWDMAVEWTALCAARLDAGDDARYLLQALLIDRFA